MAREKYELRVGDQVRLAGPGYVHDQDKIVTITMVHKGKTKGLKYHASTDSGWGTALGAEDEAEYGSWIERYYCELVEPVEGWDEEPQPTDFVHKITSITSMRELHVRNSNKVLISVSDTVGGGSYVCGLTDEQVDELITVLSYVKMEREKNKNKE